MTVVSTLQNIETAVEDVAAFLPTLNTLVASSVSQIEASMGAAFPANVKLQATIMQINTLLGGLAAADTQALSTLTNFVEPLIKSWIAAFSIPGGLFNRTPAAKP